MAKKNILSPFDRKELKIEITTPNFPANNIFELFEMKNKMDLGPEYLKSAEMPRIDVTKPFIAGEKEFDRKRKNILRI